MVGIQALDRHRYRLHRFLWVREFLHNDAGAHDQR